MSYDILPKAKLQYLLTRLKEVFDGMVQGHTIKNNTGTSMTTRTSVQFGGYLKTTDDATNDRTIIDDTPTPITWADYQALTDAQRANNKYLITDYPGTGTEAITLLQLLGMENKVTTFNNDGSISEVTNKYTKLIEFNSNGSITETVTIGSDVTIKDTVFGNGVITETLRV